MFPSALLGHVAFGAKGSGDQTVYPAANALSKS